jgi:hypothetical protein
MMEVVNTPLATDFKGIESFTGQGIHKASHSARSTNSKYTFSLAVNKINSNLPDYANGLVWLGIIESSYAVAKGGLGALSLAKVVSYFGVKFSVGKAVGAAIRF